MPRKTKEDSSFKEKLKYIGLDLENIPEFLYDYTPIEYRPTKLYDEKEFVVYKHIPVDKIQILITPENKQEDVKKKYNSAKPLSAYLNMDAKSEEQIERYTLFLNMINNTEIKEIKEIEKLQEKLADKLPFEIKYQHNYMWQIYFAPNTDKYFMLVSSQDTDFNHLFYLIKKQIQYEKGNKKECPTIFVPITDVEHSRELLSKSDINDIENYLWVFTKNWPTVYEIYDKSHIPSLYIVGKTQIYENIESMYRIKLQDKQTATRFYKQLKALFIMQTELSDYFKFNTSINENLELQFFYGDTIIDFDGLTDFIKSEYTSLTTKIKDAKIEAVNLEKELKKQKEISLKKDREFLLKQKEISTFLECRKSFFGKIKYFFKSKKNNQFVEEVKEKNEKDKNNDVVDEKALRLFIQNKNQYTIEDLVTLYAAYEKEMKYIRSLELDIHALKNKIENMEVKIANAKLYIEEIDSHKKSIFEFWKFANKDEKLGLHEGSNKQQKVKRINKTFSYELDMEDLGIKKDNEQREKLTKEEINSIFVANTDLINVLNEIKNNKENDELIQSTLDKYKQELDNEEQKNRNEDFDIFGSLVDDNTKVKILANKKHREVGKDKFNVLNISKQMEQQEFKEKLSEVVKQIDSSYGKITTDYSMPIYKLDTQDLNLDGYGIYNINIQDEIQNSDIKQNKLKLFKINLLEGMPVIYYTNILYYDNFNKTLPVGMNISSKVLLDNEKFEFNLKDKIEFNITEINKNDIFDAKPKKITLYEYDIKLKEAETSNEEE